MNESRQKAAAKCGGTGTGGGGNDNLRDNLTMRM